MSAPQRSALPVVAVSAAILVAVTAASMAVGSFPVSPRDVVGVL